MKSQIILIKEKLDIDGEVTRNWALKRFITRLGARIIDLKDEGMYFKTERVKNVKTKGWDYKYILIK